jgi:acyl-CoA synthetase (NDP forming)
MMEIALKYGMTIVGPNSAGFINTIGVSPCWFPNVPISSSTKGIAVVSKSGGVMSYVYRFGIARKPISQSDRSRNLLQRHIKL